MTKPVFRSAEVLRRRALPQAFGSRDADDARDRDRWSLHYRFDVRLPLADHVEATVYRQTSDTSQTTREQRTSRTRAKQSRLRESRYEQQVAGGWVQFNRRFTLGESNHVVAYGVDYSVTESASVRDGGTFDSTGAPLREFSPLPTRDFPLTEVAQLAVFVQDEITLLGERLTLSPGVRFDRFDADAVADDIYLAGNPGSPTPEDYEDSQATAKIGVLYNLTDTISTYARVSQGFRAPPYDVGLSARFAVAYARGEDRDTGAPLNSVDPLSSVLGIGFEAPDDRWGAEVVWTLVSGKDEADIDESAPRLASAGYGIVDVLAHLSIGQRIRLNAGLFNVTDKTYIRWADTAGIGNDAPARFTQPGFNAGLTLRIEL
ncbi:MAG: TonB-dependent receptor [Gammaproteobacteria bacterium]|nr:TonB-dependent receptor [Gammaproteobacteria bacterium]